MGGLDIVNNFIAKYRIAIKGNKWWWPLFINYVDIAVCKCKQVTALPHGHITDIKLTQVVLVERETVMELLTYCGQEALIKPFFANVSFSQHHGT